MENNHKLLLEKAFSYRGQILEHSVILEKAIEEFICKYIADTNNDIKYKITIYLIDRMSFDSKISVFQSILQSQSDKIVYKKKYDKLIGKIRMAKDERNFFAHYLTSYSQTDINTSEKNLTLVNFRNSINRKTYDEQKISSIISDIVNCATIVFKLVDEMPNLFSNEKAD